ncbi:hypothetical protein MRS44_004102 [Fusarium solani]|uniref:uncharacterized protein n=1 Tax=Fusarium solani TaxID=169388 RepID=UPI0032C3DA17|nr:hypothetical protein MRS44_004102 [Fusarium solani]
METMDSDRTDTKHRELKRTSSNNQGETILIPDHHGDDLDNAILRAQGHEAALPRSFSWGGAIGLGYSITNSWMSYTSCFGVTLAAGGPQAVVFAVIVAGFIQWTVTLGLSELASAFPSSGGQYHFTYILAPEKHRNFAAFSVGTLNVVGWWIVTCSGISLGTVSTMGLVSWWNPSFQATQWQIYLLFDLGIIITMIPIFIVPNRHMGKMTQFALHLSIVGCIIVFVSILAMCDYFQPGHTITETGGNRTGWPSGIAWILGIGNALYAYGGTDAVIHIAEEVTHPGKRLPQVMNVTMLIGIVTTVPVAIAYMFTIKDMDAVLNSPLPSMELYYQATGSKVMATFLQAWTIAVYYSALPSQWITCGRMTWAFARDKGLPYHEYWTEINKRFQLPLRATILSACFCTIYGLLYIASTAAFNSIITTAVLALNITYCVPQGICATYGRSRLPKRYLNLGNWGYIPNFFAPLWVTIIGTFFCFPGALPVEAGSMNYTSVVLFILLLLILGLWWVQRRTFEGPNIDWDTLNALNTVEDEE